jgi:hypothetical protein
MDLEQLASLLAVGAFLGGLGKRITTLVFPYGTKGKHRGWRRIWFLTMWAHPILAGVGIGLTGLLPNPAFLDNGKDFALGGAIWYGLAGMLSSAAFYRLDSMVKGPSESGNGAG